MPDAHSSHSVAQEVMLVDAIKRLDKLRADRAAVHIHLSALVPSYRRDNYIRIAADTIVSGLRSVDGQLFILSNGDLLFLAKGGQPGVIEGAVDKLRTLFGSDPLVQFRERRGPTSFCTWYRLEEDYDALLWAAQRLLNDAEQAHANAAAPTSAPIRPDLLAKLDNSLGSTDISGMVRRQTVCFAGGRNSPLDPLFDELFVSIDDLQNTITPGIDLMGNRWLFQHLTHTLDRRMMNVLMRDGIPSARPFSLNLNIATVLSPEFARFESMIAPQLRGKLVIEMDRLDIFADMGAFIFARDYLHNRGFRLCLDGLTHQTLPFLNRARLGFDLVKLYWTPDGIDNMAPEVFPSVRALIAETGKESVILCRCETPLALETGTNLGIVMFQGRHIDSLLLSQKTPNGAQPPEPPPQPQAAAAPNLLVPVPPVMSYAGKGDGSDL